MAFEALGPDAVEHLHGSPLGFAKGAEVFLFLVGRHRAPLDLLIDVVYPPFYGVDSVSVVNVVPCSVARPRIAFAQFLPRVSATRSVQSAGDKGKVRRREPKRSMGHVHCKETVLP